MYRNDTICSSTHETYTAAPVVLVETNIKEYGNGHSVLFTPKTTFELVVTPSEHYKGQITAACEYNKKLLSASWLKEHKMIIHTNSNSSVVDVVQGNLNGSILNVFKSRCRILADLFKKGFKNRTMAGYRSMLSSVLPPVQHIPRWQHPYIIRLLKWVFNSRPPTAILIPAWDLPKVLDCLNAPSEHFKWSPLKYLTMKTVFFCSNLDLQMIQ